MTLIRTQLLLLLTAIEPISQVSAVASSARFARFAPALSQLDALEANRRVLHGLEKRAAAADHAAMAQVFDTALNVSVYPQPRRDESVVDDFHGVKVADPYRWMEDPDAAETKKFVDELNAISEPFLKASSIRKELKERVMYKQKNYKEKGEVFLDPNTWSDDGTTAIRQTAWSEDGTLLAIGISEKGSDWVTVKFRKNTGEELPDVIKGVKFSSLSWITTNEGVFYSRYPSYKSAMEGVSVEKHEFHSLYYHKLGSSPDEDVLVAEFRENPNYMVTGSVTRDGRFLIVHLDKGCDPTNALYYYDLKAADNKITGKVQLKPLFNNWDAKYDFVRNDGDEFLIHTNKDCPMSKLVRVNINNLSESAWHTVIPTDPKRKLDFAIPVAGDKMMVSYVEDACDALYIHDLQTGKELERLPVSLGTVGSLWGRLTETEVFFSYDSFLEPSVIYRIDFAQPTPPGQKVQLEVVHRTVVSGIDHTKFVAKQVFYTSKDGTKIPMFIVHGKDMALDGKNPTILNGYGGFNVAEQPYFSVSRLLFIQRFGGAIAVANLRGGGEYGETWHEQGMRAHKQNVFDDFVGAAEYLVGQRYTSPAKLAIQGGSNGGLLMGAVSQQRPDLFGAVINRVGVLDMLRFHKFSIGSAWIPEYGNPENPKDFEYIFKYSPLHNIRVSPAQQWPSTLVMTADHDDRVVPAHSLKYIAQLYHTLLREAKDTQKNPIIARVEVKAGHGAGKPTHKLIDEVVDIYSFIQRVLQVNIHD